MVCVLIHESFVSGLQVSVAIPTPGARAPHAGELSAAPPPDESTLAQSVFLHRQGGLEPSASTSNDTAVATGCADAPCEMKSLWSIANGFDQDIRLREVILRHVWPFKHREKDRERTGLHYLPTQPTRVAFLVKFNQKSNETNDDMDAMLAQERYKPFSIDFNGVRNLQEQLKRSIERSENELVGTGGNRWRRDEVALAARELVSDDVVQLVMYVAILMHDVHVRCTRTDAEESLKHALEMFQGIRQRLEKKQPLRLRNAAMYLALPLVLVSCRLAVDRYFLCRLQLFTSTRQGQQAHMEAMDNIDELLDPDGYLSKVSFVQASSAALAIMHRKQKHQTGEQSYTKPTSQRINSVTKAATYTLGHAPGSARARKQFWKNVQRHPHG